MRRHAIPAVISLVLTFAGCSSDKQLKAEDLRSEITIASSLAAETELLTQRMRAHQVTDVYVRGHVKYLSQQITDSAKQLNKTKLAEETLREPANMCKSAFEQLGAELQQLPTSDERQMEEISTRAETLRKALDRAKASL